MSKTGNHSYWVAAGFFVFGNISADTGEKQSVVTD
ncbi:hypothetical protein JOC78_001617 [Bacillus ectoiniformans]|nr:hypothetical protein [Bacillus ectoiniformans]